MLAVDLNRPQMQQTRTLMRQHLLTGPCRVLLCLMSCMCPVCALEEAALLHENICCCSWECIMLLPCGCVVEVRLGSLQKREQFWSHLQQQQGITRATPRANMSHVHYIFHASASDYMLTHSNDTDILKMIVAANPTAAHILEYPVHGLTGEVKFADATKNEACYNLLLPYYVGLARNHAQGSS